MSGNVLEERYRAITFQFESCTHLTKVIETFEADLDLGQPNRDNLRRELDEFAKTRTAFAAWFVTAYNTKSVEQIACLTEFQKQLACMAGVVMTNVLMPACSRSSRLSRRSSISFVHPVDQSKT